MTRSTPSAGHDPALPSVTRRTLLGAPALVAVSAPALASTETPILRLFREWEALTDLVTDRGPTEAQAGALDSERYVIEDAIKAEPPTDLRELAIKVLVNSGEGVFGVEDWLTLEYATLAGRSFDKLPRILFEEEADRAVAGLGAVGQDL